MNVWDHTHANAEFKPKYGCNYAVTREQTLGDGKRVHTSSGCGAEWNK